MNALLIIKSNGSFQYDHSDMNKAWTLRFSIKECKCELFSEKKTDMFQKWKASCAFRGDIHHQETD